MEHTIPESGKGRYALVRVGERKLPGPHRGIILYFLSVAVVFMGACQRPVPAPATFQDYSQQSPRTFDPARATDITSIKVLSKIHRGLWKMDAAGNLKPELAAGLKMIQPDRWEIRLADSRRFAAGSPVRAWDAALSLARLKSKALFLTVLGEYLSQGPGRKLWFPNKTIRDQLVSSWRDNWQSAPYQFVFQEIRELRVVDDLTFQIGFSGAPGPFRQKLTMAGAYIYDWKNLLTRYVREVIGDRAVSPRALLARPEIFRGAGAWKLVSYTPGEVLRLERKKKPRAADCNRQGKDCAWPAFYQYRFIQEEASARFLFLRGQLDVFNPPPFLVGDLPERFRARAREAQAIYYVAINRSRSDLDRYLALALNHAIDKKIIVKKLLGGRVPLANSPVPRALLPGSENAGALPTGDDTKINRLIHLKQSPEPAFAHSLKKARGYLKQSVWKNRPLRLLVKNDSEEITQARVMARMWARLGIEVVVEPMEKNQLLERNNRSDGDLYFFNWFADYPDAENFLIPLFHSRNKGLRGNRAHYENPGLDQLLDELAAEPEANRRAGLVARIIPIILADPPWVFLWGKGEIAILGRRLARYPVYDFFTGDRGENIRLKQ